jgi:hypothetical protein
VNFSPWFGAVETGKRGNTNGDFTCGVKEEKVFGILVFTADMHRRGRESDRF